MLIPTKEFIEIFKKTEGALSVCESIAIMNVAAQASKFGEYLELGVYHGKSAMSAIYGFVHNHNYEDIWEREWEWEENRQPPRTARFTLVDPIFDTDHKDYFDIYSKMKSLNSGLTWSIRCSSSLVVIPTREKWDYVFVDSGSHQDGLPMREVKLLEDRITKGGIIAFHDYNSQFIEVKQAYDYLLSTGKYEEIKIDWDEIITYVKENDLEKGNNSWHHTEMDFPCFVGALRRK